MQDAERITLWIDRLKRGDEEAASKIWDEFFPRVQGLARKRLGSLPQRDYDADDLALSALNALCRGAEQGKFQQLENSSDLWQILAMITVRKAAAAWRKKSRSPEVGESIFQSPDGDVRPGMQQVPDGRAPAELVDALSDTCADLLAQLDDRLREVALLRLSGYSNEEIAEKVGRSVKSIERYMKMIREIWKQPGTDV
jgi:DNA-directed RNA polymerase specialized sigma24 family protein